MSMESRHKTQKPKICVCVCVRAHVDWGPVEGC